MGRVGRAIQGLVKKNEATRPHRRGFEPARHEPSGHGRTGESSLHRHQVAMRTQLSIVIPHRNTPEKLRRLLDSIPESPRIDVVVVDDNSDLGLEANQLRPDYAHVRFFANPGPELNAGSARNHGLVQVRSEWVLFADADDYFVDNGLDVVLESVESVSDDTDMVFFDVTSCNEHTGNVGTRHKVSSTILQQYLADGCEVMLRYGWPGPVAKAIRFELLEQIGIRFDSVLAGNDVIFSQLCGHHSRKIRCVNRIAYCITESGHSLTSNLTPERALARLGVLVRANTNLMRWGVKKRMDWGVTWFLKSLPGRVSKEKVQIYGSYVAFFLKRALRFR
jgi:glycosyltransferase involved in cell wall biosynthesis